VIFHEGALGGVDQQVYEVLFAGQTASPVGSCTEVLRAVAGLRESSALHWVTPRGVVDKDFRRGSLPDGVYQLALHEMENIFYTQTCIRRIAEVQAEMLGYSADQLEIAALSARQSTLSDPGVRANILAKWRLQLARDELMDKVLSLTSVGEDGVSVEASALPPNGMAQEYDRLVSVFNVNDEFLQLLPIRESGLRSRVSKELKYSSSELYERAIIQQLRQVAEFRERVLKEIGLAQLAED
jgi:hypothetical protein